MNPTDDGVTHINVYSRGRTELGRALSNFAHTPFEHPEDGHFESVEGYWYWLSTRDERLRNLWGWEAKSVGRQLGGSDYRDEPEFRRKVCLALDVKIDSHPDLHRMLVESTLPLAHYYEYDGVIHTPKKGRWVIDHLTQLRALDKLVITFRDLDLDD
jgi:hypothetical protein